jgi:non-heme chloroperoxidase
VQTANGVRPDWVLAPMRARPGRHSVITMSNETTHELNGGGDVRLHVRESGNPDGPAILFVHGWSQSQLCWAHQIDSPLADEFHLVTFDLRGHGMSEKPRSADQYQDWRLWADDVAAVITETDLECPVLVGWSYGGFVVADYLRAHGEDTIAGVNLVGGAVVMKPPTFDHIGPGFLENAPDASGPDLATNIAAIQRFVSACTARPLPAQDRGTVLCWNMVVPPEVRGALIAREIDTDDVLSGLSIPVLVTHGRSDTIVLPSMAQHVLDVCTTAKPSWYDDVGHMPFSENPARFNHELAGFVADARRYRVASHATSGH